MAETAFVLLEADSFDEVLQGFDSTGDRPGLTPRRLKTVAPVRRPLRGTQLREDTWASIQVITSDRRFLEMVNSGAAGRGTGPNINRGVTYSYTNFVLESIQDTREEKFQSVETFGSDYGFFFGERPRVIQATGKLVDTPDFPWHTEWWHNYEETFRGTQLVRRGARIYFSYETRVFEGYLLGSSTNKNARNPDQADLTFNMWVTGYRDISNIGDPMFPGGDVEPISPADIQKYNSYGGAAVPRGLEVRKLNISATSVSGISDVINNAVDMLSGGYGNKLSSALGLDYLKNVLLGKQVRVPIGFAGSDLLTAQNELASGTIPAGFTSASGVSAALQSAQQGTVPQNPPVKNLVTRGEIYANNPDEYVQAGDQQEADWWREQAKAEGILELKALNEEGERMLLERQARQAFLDKGLNPDAFLSKDAIFFTRLTYGVAAYGVSTGLEIRRKKEEDWLRAERLNRNAYDQGVAGPYDPDLDQINYGAGGEEIFGADVSQFVEFIG